MDLEELVTMKHDVAVEQRTFPGVTHEFFGMTPVLAKARDAQAMAAAALRRAFGEE